ncbi:hypothetical protein [Pontibacter harenae]|uniref:hypothetical protein n=1 Tax=Pontibacter harenae TaxID=2894083 RepID=UPI001E61E4AB|nr:hypothetical protein [Pontibacter harenae]MCC9168469.1 hypothetical protein [Pontibacter harenae]
MKKLFRSYLPALLMGSLLFSTACKDDDDPTPPVETEMITTVQLNLMNEEKGLSAVASWRDLEGDGNPDTQALTLKPNVTYTGTITFLDENKNPVENITEEIEEEAEDHQVFYSSTAPGLTITATDQDANQRPVGLEYTLVTTSEGSGNIRIVLKHQPGTKNGNINTGDTDVDVIIPVTVAQ